MAFGVRSARRDCSRFACASHQRNSAQTSQELLRRLRLRVADAAAQIERLVQDLPPLAGCLLPPAKNSYARCRNRPASGYRSSTRRFCRAALRQERTPALRGTVPPARSCPPRPARPAPARRENPGAKSRATAPAPPRARQTAAPAEADNQKARWIGIHVRPVQSSKTFLCLRESYSMILRESQIFGGRRAATIKAGYCREQDTRP